MHQKVTKIVNSVNMNKDNSIRREPVVKRCTKCARKMQILRELKAKHGRNYYKYVQIALKNEMDK